MPTEFRVRLFPYKQTSASAKVLAHCLAILQLRQEGSRFVPRNGDVVINWGNSTSPLWNNGRGTIINPFETVAKACNKLITFQWLTGADVETPDWTTHQDQAQQWVDEGHKVYGRQTLTGHSGQGIVMFYEGEIDDNYHGTVTPCPLYTKNTKTKYEYRIHVMNSTIIDQQQKKKREGFNGGVAGIRNFANGWVFCREEVVVPECVKQVSLQAVQALGLHFGAVDVGYNQTEGKAYVYEVNTAPGLEGTTLERYVAGFKEHYLGQF